MAQNLGIEIKVPNARAQASRIKSQFLAQVEDDVRRAVKVIAETLEDEIRFNISFTGTSLEDLARMGHPFARSNSIRSPLPKPWQVHIQKDVRRGSGGGPKTLTEALGIDFYEEVGAIGAFVGIDEDEAEHVRWVVNGTRTMVARDFLTETLREIEDRLWSMFAQETGYRRVK